MSKPIANLAELQMRSQSKGTRYGFAAGRIGDVIGMQQLGGQYMVVPPGKAAFPRHAHHKNEELFVILEGEGEYRRGDERWPVRSGDLISAPAGGGDTAHQLTNTSDRELRYLSISTRHDLDVTEYPDSGKFILASGIPPGRGMMSAKFGYIGRAESGVDYWDGEDIGDVE